VTPENCDIPGRALRERQADLGWIVGNLDLFWTAAIAAFEDAGRGAIVVDTTSQPVPGAGHSFAYFSQEQVEDHGNEDAVRQMSEYDPAQELVVVLPKSGDRTSTYRVCNLGPGLREDTANPVATDDAGEAAAKPKLRPPD